MSLGVEKRREAATAVPAERELTRPGSGGAVEQAREQRFARIESPRPLAALATQWSSAEAAKRVAEPVRLGAAPEGPT